MPIKKTSLADVLTEFRTKEKVQIGPLSAHNMVPQGLSTGNLVLDALTGIGGLPKGHVVELFGKPSSGKTTTALQAAARLQAAGGVICYWDFERTLDESYVRALGVDTDAPSFIYYQPKSFEDGANKFRRLLGTGEVDMVIHDSVAKMVTESELTAPTGKANVADRAKMMHQYMRQIVDSLYDTGCCATFLNHVLDLVDTTPMGQKLAAQGVKRQTTPGGMALSFYSSLRVEFKPVGNLRDTVLSAISGQKEDQIRQTKIQATVVKNKVGDPFGVAELRIRFGRGFSNEWTVFNLLRDHGVIKPRGGGYFSYPEELEPPNELCGEDNIIHYLETDHVYFAKLHDEAVSILRTYGLDKIDPTGLDENGVELDASGLTLGVLETEFDVDQETGEIRD